MSLYQEQNSQSSGAGTVPIDLGQHWLKSVFLAGILVFLLFVMAVTIFLVATRPAPMIPESNNKTGSNGPALAVIQESCEIG